eukprot:CAMPEP_0168742216 /NCGR_PEP_ID=MMETSP0724-20121128/12920_1 /TAXON_ID=265536 /ORGANISM="Amphiprora sp., Strain CCMP467" /LENGTH=217 /DNA_ID=CAMNT_0008789755 /DNA_START=50 /DNA_END=703 /DNA_ORIENTATION=-
MILSGLLRVASTRSRVPLATDGPRFVSLAAGTSATWSKVLLQTTTSSPSLVPSPQQQQVRTRHSNTQIKRLLKNPKRDRLDREQGIERIKSMPPEIVYQPIWEPKMLRNGWSPLPPADVEVPSYPFSVKRTGNKPQNAVGFLPVYSKMRKDGTKAYTRIKKVGGDRDRFVQELRAVLEIPTPKNPKEDKIRIRTGGTIEVDGNFSKDVRLWLAGLGF